MKESQTTTPGTTCPTLFRYRPLLNAKHVTVKIQETSLTVYRRDPRRLECLAIWQFNCKVYIPQLFKDPYYWSGLGLKPSTSCTADWRSTN